MVGRDAFNTISVDLLRNHYSSLIPKKVVTLTLGYTTIVTQIGSCQTQALESYLRTEVAPQFDVALQFDPNAIIRCQKFFPFDEIKGLHFCSMLILQGVDQSDLACLVFEATFDGTSEEFLDDLLRVAPEGIHKIYKNCIGYPGYWVTGSVAGLAVPALVKEYLAKHDVGANAFYSGSPGRTVAQIQGEQQIREEIADFISKQRRSISPPTSFLGLQRELQHEVIRK